MAFSKTTTQHDHISTIQFHLKSKDNIEFSQRVKYVVCKSKISKCEMTMNVCFFVCVCMREYLAVSYQQLVAAVFVQAEVIGQRQGR